MSRKEKWAKEFKEKYNANKARELPAPSVPAIYDAGWEKFANPIDKTMRPPVPSAQEDDTVVTNTVDELIPLALDIHYRILKHTPLEPHSEDYVANAKLVLATAQSILNTQIKVDENQLRKRKADDVVKILSELRDEEKKQAAFDLLVAE